jgi:hypothetical protein
LSKTVPVEHHTSQSSRHLASASWGTWNTPRTNHIVQLLAAVTIYGTVWWVGYLSNLTETGQIFFFIFFLFSPEIIDEWWSR